MTRTRSGPGAALLELARGSGRDRRRATPPAPLSMDELAGHLGIDRGRCLRLVFELIDEGRLGAEFHPGGRLRLRAMR
jgi:hypothetical protein